MTDDRFELPEQARKIRDREALEIERQVREAETRLTSTSSALSAVCRLLTIRQRYMGAVGEHYSVQDLEGILVVDFLDERVLRGLGQLLRVYSERTRKKASPQADEFVHRCMPPGFHEMPKYPVAFMVLHALRVAIERFEEGSGTAETLRVTDMELALLRLLLDAVDHFVKTRDMPVQRHFSDVEREYSSVGRLKCSCGEAKYQVSMQSLHSGGTDVPFDRLELQCDACGARRSVTFDLPYFKDLYQM